MTTKSRIVIGLVGLAVSALQFFVGAVASMGLGAPGVGPEADWVPRTLMFEAVTLVPVAFALCIWGSAWALRLAAAAAVVSAAIGVAGSVLLARAGGLGGFLVMTLVPAVALAATVVYAWRGRSRTEGARLPPGAERASKPAVSGR